MPNMMVPKMYLLSKYGSFWGVSMLNNEACTPPPRKQARLEIESKIPRKLFVELRTSKAGP